MITLYDMDKYIEKEVEGINKKKEIHENEQEDASPFLLSKERELDVDDKMKDELITQSIPYKVEYLEDKMFSPLRIPKERINDIEDNSKTDDSGNEPLIKLTKTYSNTGKRPANYYLWKLLP